MLFETLAAAGNHIVFTDLGLDPVALRIGGYDLIKWYSLAYITGIVVGWLYLQRMLKEPGAPMSRVHADDLIFYATLGIILGGRLGYALFYKPSLLINPLQLAKLWEGGMSFHGGAIGVVIAVWLLSRKHRLNGLRIIDYVACVAPIGQFLGRLANFVNGELWGRKSDAPWAIVFPHTVPVGVPDPARHPSQLYEALGEGLILFLVLNWFFWRTDARYYPGRLVGIGLAGFGGARFLIEFFREPDEQLRTFAETTGLNMGQWLCLPMIFLGVYFIVTSKKRRQRVEPIAGSESVA